MTTLYARINGNYVTLEPPVNGNYKRLRGGRAFMVNQAPANGKEIDVVDVAQKINQLRLAVAANFIGRDELAHAIALALVIGEHIFVEGAPGTAKSSVLRLFGEGLQASFWRVVMNPDLPRDELVGTLDPQALSQGEWKRKWSGIATTDLAMVDETWKASPQVINILLDALEERRVSSGGEDINIPLHIAMGASNEFPDKGSNAAFDRFLFRVLVDYVSDMDLFEKMLFAEAGSTPIPVVAHIDEVRLLAAWVEATAKDKKNLPKDVIQTVLSMRREFAHMGVSDRRWQKLVKAIVGMALLDGQITPTARHAICAKWIILNEKAEAKEIREKVMALCDPLGGVVLSLEEGFASLQREVNQLDSNSKNLGAEVMEVTKRVNALMREAKDVSKNPNADDYHYRLSNLIESCQDLMDEAYSKKK